MHQPAARVEFHEGIVHELFAVGERHRGGMLGDGVRVAGGMALERRHGADDGLGTRGVADAPAGHGVGLGNAVDHDRLRADFVAQRSDGNVLLAVVNQLLIDFVGDDVKLLLHGQRGDALQQRARIHAAAGVVGRIKNQRLRALGDEGAQRVRVHKEAVRLVARHHHRHAAGHAHHFRIADPAGRGQKHLVAGVEDGAERVEQALFRAVGNDDVGEFIVQTVVAQKLLLNFRAQLHGSGHGRVFGHARVQRIARGAFDIAGRVKVRLARAEADHVQPHGAQLLGARVDGQRDRRMNVSAFFRDCQSHFERPFPHFLPTHIMPHLEENCKIKYDENSKLAFVSKENGTHRICMPFYNSICFKE